MRMAAHCGCPETDSFSGRAITSSSFANSRRFFCGCFVIMMAVIQIAILHSNLFDSRGSLTNFRGCFFVRKIAVLLIKDWYDIIKKIIPSMSILMCHL